MAFVSVTLRIKGLVQGVGFRPTFWRLATHMQLSGEVCNDAQGVLATLEGDERIVERFLKELPATLLREAPLARLDSVTTLKRIEIPPTPPRPFSIAQSHAGTAHTMITPDAATCRACLADLIDPQNRRYRYAFTNCTHCGPRLTITRKVPYDRAETSMSNFALCPDCRKEYEDPADRRFHAQPNACPTCGPELSFLSADGTPQEGDPIALTLTTIREGGIVAIKGIGGFHLVCNAADNVAVKRLRDRKARREKPLAVMLANIPSAKRWVHVSDLEEKEILSVAHPIVLLGKKLPETLACDLAPGLNELGILLPYTPVHWLLFHEAAGRPSTVDALTQTPIDLALVMTSANPSGEPIVFDNQEAQAQLKDIADAFLLHNRDIVTPCDDSVVKLINETPALARRSRGYAPNAVNLATSATGLVGLGAWLKTTVCVVREREAFVSQHVGDTATRATCELFEKTLSRTLDFLAVKPRLFAHDLHPDFFTTRLAERLAKENEVPSVAVQHHHAHLAAVAAENADFTSESDVAGLVLDGVGLGSDGTLWGGEALRIPPTQPHFDVSRAEPLPFERAGHLLAIPQPGGDKAAKEPWRMAASLAVLTDQTEAIEKLWPEEARALPLPITELVARPHLSPLTSSAGRLFDAAAAVAGLASYQREEAHAAQSLESAAARWGATERLMPSDAYRIEAGVLDFRALFHTLIAMRLAKHAPEAIAATFLSTFCYGLVDWAQTLFADRKMLYCTGGCLINRILSETLTKELAGVGIRVITPRQLPAGDGAVSFGQCAAVLHAAPDFFKE